ncbi:MAG: M15 family metallopeptidase [Aeromicrobium sp.]|uniref:M15 family metallopeptidase n=1 Tax=Aeromicrobium sp. TaxID=1871063 RepID=UPI0039E5A7E2
MSHDHADRRGTAGVLGAFAVCSALLATVAETPSAPEERPTVSDLSGSVSPVSLLAPPDPATGAGGLDHVSWDSDGIVRVDGHLLVNKSFPLPAWYDPGGLDPQLVAAFDAMQAEAAQDGVSLRIVSGYRSYADQQDNYQARVAAAGVEAADRGMARPGHSEHQAGLAIDVNDVSASFADTAAGRWVAENAHRFGFVIRYPDGKEDITGFKYEPWHLRYLDVDLATRLVTAGLTLEEYYGLPSSY